MKISDRDKDELKQIAILSAIAFTFIAATRDAVIDKWLEEKGIDLREYGV
jgi:hypothetical protein